MAVQLNRSPLYVKGTAEMWVRDIVTGDFIGFSNKIDTSNFTSSVNAGEIRAGIGAPIVINIPDSATFSGEVTANDFSLEARQLATGGNLKYNGTAPYQETITATDTTLKVTRDPVSAYGEPSDASTYTCFVGSDGVNYTVDPKTKVVQGFTAQKGQTYCVRYFVELASAQELSIPTQFNPTVANVTIKMAVYGAQGGNAMNGSRVGNLYIVIPRAQLLNGAVGVNGSQTEAATTPWSFSALAYDEADVTCSECALDNSVLGYMVYVPCGTDAATRAVKALAIVGGIITVKAQETAQTPVFYVMEDNEVVTPNYSDLTFKVAEDGGSYATVGEHTGVITGSSAGSTTITVTVTAKPTLTATANVTVTSAD